MEEETVQVTLALSTRLDQWAVELPTTRSIDKIMPSILKALRVSESIDRFTVLWSEGERELTGKETPRSAGLGHGHTLNLALREIPSERRKQKVFISYSRRDHQHLDRLRVHLKPLERANLIDAWADDRILIGENWKDRISESLDVAKAAVLMISADYLASDFIIDEELPKILSKAEEKGTTIFPVILSICRFTREPSLNRFQTVNNPEKPLVELAEHQRERIYDQVARAIEEALASS